MSTLVFDLSGQAETSGSISFTFVDIEGAFSVFDYASRTVIDPVVISSLAVTASSQSPSADLSITGSGLASVNGSQTAIAIAINRSAGVLSYRITDPNTDTLLASGTGEAGRAALELTVSGP